MLTARRRSTQLLGVAVALKGLAWVGSRPGYAACFLLLGLVLTSGRWRRATAGTTSALAWTVTLSGHYTSHHFTLMALLTAYVAFTGRPEDGRDTLRPAEVLFMAQISTVYLYGALWKLNPEFLSGSVVGIEWELSWLLGPDGASQELAAAAAIGSVIAELFIAVTLWLTRVPLAAVSIAMILIHGGMVLTIGMDLPTTLELVAFGAMTGSALPFFGVVRRQGRPSTPMVAAASASSGR